MIDPAPFLIYGGVVVFWSIIFVVALILTRRSLRGVGEPVPDPEETPTADPATASAPIEVEQGSPTRAAGGAH
ncbi:MAG TPA: hypothetical protein VGN32_12080 [Ktedonobacterales bacterium]|jgi:hypothetical protein|nr:hypothetical protein [Ktedonobacterales bacterium]